MSRINAPALEAMDRPGRSQLNQGGYYALHMDSSPEVSIIFGSWQYTDEHGVLDAGIDDCESTNELEFYFLKRLLKLSFTADI